jgi:hypothetical protein
MKNLICIICSIVFLSCGTKTKEGDVKIIATTGEKNLTVNDYNKFNFMGGISKDSLLLANRFIERWAKDELFYSEARKKLLPEDLDVEAEVEKYKQELIDYKYEVKLIENNLDTNITKQEILDYYETNKENFILKDNIVKVNYFKVPLSSKALDKIKKCVWSLNPKDKEQLKNLCTQYADNYFINDSTWLLLEDVKKEIPQLKELPEYNFYKGRVFQYSDTLNFFYLKINEIKIKNSLSPVNFERNNIKNILLNQRKMNLIRQYKQQIFDKAKSENRFKII